MDSDGDKQNKRQILSKRKETNFIQRYVANVGNVLSPIWLRRPIQINNGYKWFVLGSRFHFLFYFRMFLVVLYISYEVLK
jgi:hypothetical protein